MKRIRVLLTIVLLCLLLGCQQPFSYCADENTIWIVVELDLADPVYEIAVAYETDAGWNGERGGSNADGSAITDPTFGFDFLREDFPNDAMFDEMTFDFYIRTEPEKPDMTVTGMVEVGAVRIPVRFGEVHRVHISNKDGTCTVEYLGKDESK